MKKFSVGILAAIFVMSFTACDGKSKASDSDTSAVEEALKENLKELHLPEGLKTLGKKAFAEALL